MKPGDLREEIVRLERERVGIAPRVMGGALPDRTDAPLLRRASPTSMTTRTKRRLVKGEGMNEPKAPDYAGTDPRRVCEGTILREERNLAQLRQYRLHLAVPYTMGDEHAIEQVGVTEQSMERCSRRLGLARLALEALEREEASR